MMWVPLPEEGSNTRWDMGDTGLRRAYCRPLPSFTITKATWRATQAA